MKEGEILMDRGGTGQPFRQQRPRGAVVCSGSSGPRSNVKIHVGFCLPSSPGNDRFCRVLANPHLPGTFQCCCRSSCWLRCSGMPAACRERVSQGPGDCHQEVIQSPITMTGDCDQSSLHYVGEGSSQGQVWQWDTGGTLHAAGAPGVGRTGAQSSSW